MAKEEAVSSQELRSIVAAKEQGSPNHPQERTGQNLQKKKYILHAFCVLYQADTQMPLAADKKRTHR